MNGTDPASLVTAIEQATDALAGGPPSDTGGGSLAVIDSNVLPPIPLGGGGGGGLGEWLARIARPSVMGSVPLYGPVAIAPYGQPTPGLGTIVFASFIFLAGYGLVRLMRG